MTEKSARLSNEGSYHDSLQEEDEENETAPLTGQSQLKSQDSKPKSRLSIGLRIILASILVIASTSIIYHLLSSNSSSASTSSTSTTSTSTDSQFWFDSGWRQSDDSSHQSERLDSSNIVFGLGIGDVTGPIVQTNQMGYASLPQTNTGLHIRQRSRAFIVGNSASGTQRKAKKLKSRTEAEGEQELTSRKWAKRDDGEDPVDGLSDRWVFINSDICMVSHIYLYWESGSGGDNGVAEAHELE